jgi:AhpD family alkylhydroperoxidase
VHSGTFTEAEIQTLLLTNAVTNSCAWAVAFHTNLALKAGLAPADVQAIRERRSPRDSRYAALSAYARGLIEKRGHVGDAAVTALLSAVFRPDQALEALAVSAASAITNYTLNVAEPPLEPMFKEHAWRP